MALNCSDPRSRCSGRLTQDSTEGANRGRLHRLVAAAWWLETVSPSDGERTPSVSHFAGQRPGPISAQITLGVSFSQGNALVSYQPRATPWVSSRNPNIAG